jgi:hypothetical protein
VFPSCRSPFSPTKVADASRSIASNELLCPCQKSDGPLRTALFRAVLSSGPHSVPIRSPERLIAGRHPVCEAYRIGAPSDPLRISRLSRRYAAAPKLRGLVGWDLSHLAEVGISTPYRRPRLPASEHQNCRRFDRQRRSLARERRVRGRRRIQHSIRVHQLQRLVRWTFRRRFRGERLQISREHLTVRMWGSCCPVGDVDGFVSACCLESAHFRDIMPAEVSLLITIRKVEKRM